MYLWPEIHRPQPVPVETTRASTASKPMRIGLKRKAATVSYVLVLILVRDCPVSGAFWLVIMIDKTLSGLRSSETPKVQYCWWLRAARQVRIFWFHRLSSLRIQWISMVHSCMITACGFSFFLFSDIYLIPLLKHVVHVCMSWQMLLHRPLIHRVPGTLLAALNLSHRSRHPVKHQVIHRAAI